MSVKYYNIIITIMGELVVTFTVSLPESHRYATELFELVGLKPKLQYFQDNDIIMSVFKTRKNN